jgi:CheY-like chemotaxis protein
MHIPTILFVEDDPIIQQLYASESTAQGLGFIQVTDGLSALEILQKGEQIDGVVIDLMIPGIPGNALLEIVQKQYGNLLTVVVSAVATQTDPLEAIKHGAVATITKGDTKIKDIIGAMATILRATDPQQSPELAA